MPVTAGWPTDERLEQRVPCLCGANADMVS